MANALITGPPATLIYNDWYPAMRSEALQGKQMVTAMLLGIPMVLGRREDGHLFAMRDLCPHRGIPLSCGWFDGKSLTCKYHGWAFEPVSGQCLEIPSLTKDDTFPRNLHGMAYPCEERDGYAWVYVPEAGRGRVKAEDAATEPVPEAAKFGPRFRTAHLTAELPCNVDHGIIGLMDPAHGPFVHQAWWWRKQASIHEK
jgi:phenylpropionate dioxygenase-like ring-hydroxylating dioxygenase large terminal subunit